MMTCCEVTTGNALWYHVMEIFGDPLTRQTSVTESNCVTFWSDGDSFTTGGSGERTRSRTASTVLAWLFIVHALCMEACRKSVTVAPTRTIQNKLPRTSLSRVKQKTKMVQSKHHIITHKTNHHHHHQPHYPSCPEHHCHKTHTRTLYISVNSTLSYGYAFETLRTPLTERKQQVTS